jgi:TPR repeat protein
MRARPDFALHGFARMVSRTRMSVKASRLTCSSGCDYNTYVDTTRASVRPNGAITMRSLNGSGRRAAVLIMLTTHANATNHELWERLFDVSQTVAARSELTTRAKNNDPEAQWTLSNWLSWRPGRGYGPHTRHSVAWLFRSAMRGFVPAMVEAATYLEAHPTRGGALVRANRLYRAAARRGSADSAWNLGLNAEAAFDSKRANLAVAFSWFMRAAALEPERGNGWKAGEYALAGLVPRRRARVGLRALERAADTGQSAEAEFYMGLRAYLGCDCAVDIPSAMRWFRRSASNRMATSTDHGERCAHALLGRLLAFSPTTRRQGLHHLTVAADAGLPIARVDLALASLTMGRPSKANLTQLRRAVRDYGGNWRNPGTPWLGIERLSHERVRLALDLLGRPRARVSSPYAHVTHGFARREPATSAPPRR